MITTLNPQFARWHFDADLSGIRDAIERERALVRSPGHLVDNVIGDTEFAWDFRCLDSGFRELVEPYWNRPSGMQALLHSICGELGIDEASMQTLALMVEFVHMGILVNDDYCCNPDLARHETDRHRVHRLTQIRYAGQFLSVYPRYLLMQNRLDLDAAPQILAHTQFSDVSVTQSIARGVLLKWAGRGFAGIRPNWYRQHAANMMINYAAFPILLALVLSGRDREALDRVKPALGHLSIAMKMGIERAVLLGAQPVDAFPADHRATACMLGLPVMALVRADQALEPLAGSEFHLPVLPELFDRALTHLPPGQAGLYDEEIDASLERFLEALQVERGLMNWGERLAATLRDDPEAPDA